MGKMLYGSWLLAVAFGLALAAALVLDVAGAAESENHECVTILAPQKCNSSGSSYCNQEAQDGSCDGGDCHSCDHVLAVPNKSCLYWEDETCVHNFPYDCVDCGLTKLKRGECGEANGICQCMNQQTIGMCPNMYMCLCTE